MILEYKNVNIFQGKHLVLHDVNMELHEGEMAYLTGAVGSGKTTLLKTIYGELPCQGEKASVLDTDLLQLRSRKIPAFRRQLGIVFQDFKLLTDRSVKQNLDFVLRSTGWKKKEDREQRIQEVMEQVKLNSHLDKFPYELSGGEQQRVCIARALLNNPQLILADEPTGNLDPENGELILAVLDEIRRKKNTTILLSTHNMLWPQFFPGTVYHCDMQQIHREE